MSRESMGTNVSQGIVDRIVAGVRYAVSGVTPENWFGPQQPLAPQAQEKTEGRQFDYPVGYNLRITPREGETAFSLLRGLADGYDLLRLAIETRKDQIESFEWEIVPLDPKKSSDSMRGEIDRVTDFMRYPDKQRPFSAWLRMQLEDLFVIDGVAVYPRETRGGDLYAFELIDAATLKVVIDDTGRTPLPPDPAYQQILKGIPTADYSRDDLVYMMRNPRTNRLYGFSPVEQVMMTVNIAMRRQLSQLDFYTQGNIPEAIAQMPEGWTEKQIREFQLWWDGVLEGNTAQKRRMRFIPSLKDIKFPKEQVLKDEYDEWLARIVCFAFSITPSALIKQVNRASGEQMADTAKEEGLLPLLRCLESHLTLLINKYLGATDLRFRFKVMNKVDPKAQADIHGVYIDKKVLTPDEVREDIGRDAMTPEQREEAFPAPAPMIGFDGKPVPGAEGEDGVGADGKPLVGAAAATVAAKDKADENAAGKAPQDEQQDEETPAEKMLRQAITLLDPARSADALAKAISSLPPPAPVQLGDTFVTVPPQTPPNVSVYGDTQVVAPPVPMTKRVRAWRDPSTGEMVGDVQMIGDPGDSIGEVTKALQKMRGNKGDAE